MRTSWKSPLLVAGWLVMGALLMLAPAVSQADQDSEQGAPWRPHREHHKKHHVPELSTDALLLFGLGVTGLVGYGVQRRTQEG